MPIYEYRCKSCNRTSSIFFRSFNSTEEPVCSHCNGKEMDRLISRVAIIKNSLQRIEEYDSREHLRMLDDPRDPAAIRSWAKRIDKEMGDELGSSFKEMAEQFSAGDGGYDMYDPLYAYEAAIDKRWMELREEKGLPVPEPYSITDEIIDSTPYHAPGEVIDPH